MAMQFKEIRLLTCREASRLASQAQDRPLKLKERIGLKLHLLICVGCQGFTRQLQQMRQACQRVTNSEGMNVKTEVLSTTAKARILQEIMVRQGHKS
jgi:hypothetical protein